MSSSSSSSTPRTSSDDFRYSTQHFTHALSEIDDGFQNFTEYVTAELYKQYLVERNRAWICDRRSTLTFDEYIEGLDDCLNTGKNIIGMVEADNGDWSISAQGDEAEGVQVGRYDDEEKKEIVDGYVKYFENGGGEQPWDGSPQELNAIMSSLGYCEHGHGEEHSDSDGAEHPGLDEVRGSYA